MGRRVEGGALDELADAELALRLELVVEEDEAVRVVKSRQRLAVQAEGRRVLEQAQRVTHGHRGVAPHLAELRGRGEAPKVSRMAQHACDELRRQLWQQSCDRRQL